MKIHRREFITYTGAALTLPAAAQSVSAWPSHPLKIVVGFPPGQSSDIATRIVAEELSHVLGQPVLVENRPGAGATLAHELVIKQNLKDETASWAKVIQASGAKLN